MALMAVVNKVVDSAAANTVAPAVAVSTFMGVALSDWVYIATLGWIGIQVYFKLRKELRKDK